MSGASGTDDRLKRPSIPLSVEPATPVPPTAAQKRVMRAAKRQIAAVAAPTELRVGHDQRQHPIVGMPHTEIELNAALAVIGVLPKHHRPWCGRSSL
jgi:hypothetical protein